MRRRVAALLLPAFLLTLVLTGCGAGGTSDRAPAGVVQALSRVESALVARDWAQARAALDDLVRRTVLAQRSGEITEERAGKILAAAAQLASGVPRTTPSPSPSPSATSVPTRAVEPREDEGDDEEKKGKGRGKGKD